MIVFLRGGFMQIFEYQYKKQVLANRYRVLMHVHCQVFQGPLIEIKLDRTFITFIVLGRVEKNAKKRQKKCKKYFFFKQLSKCDTCFYAHFSRAFLKYSFQICSFSPKKVMGYLRFFYILRFFYRPAPYLRHKKNYQKIL